mmetsp:Transcript_15609/g.36525  ORF Transcript_15609/g.36525 Transcript_15609/m.36525 type:complete len:305 (+) Transcript_15609:96-1010(+)
MAEPMPQAGAQGYGALAVSPKKYRRQSPLIGIALALLVPVLAFVLVYALLSFSLHYTSATLCYVAVAVLGACFLFYGAYGVWRAFREYVGETNSHSGWMMFTAATGLLAVALGIVLGMNNFSANMLPYYEIENLNVYHSVDPSRYRGNQLMDAGQFYFADGAHIDKRFTMGFKSFDIYCVAPVVGPGSSSLSNYDFWAVGKNCCSGGSSRDFRCGEATNPDAAAGLRLTNDADREFYRLVVQQAEAAYGLKANHPVFLYWLQDPEVEHNLYSSDGSSAFLHATLVYFAVQLLAVIIAVLVFAKS